MISRALVFSVVLLAASAEPARAQEPEGPGIASLADLAATLGEAHAIRSLCNGDNDQTWRNYMQNLMDLEAPSGARRSSLTSAFNRGYRTQSSRHKSCTPDLPSVEAQIAARGRAIAETIAQSYLN